MGLKFGAVSATKGVAMDVSTNLKLFYLTHEKGKPLAYINRLLQVSFTINQGDFAKVNHIASGSEWSVEVSLKWNN